MRHLLLHEARIHAIPGRDLRDLGDTILLHDPVEPEPFWNRLEGLRWPSDPTAFDRRLTEALVLFASIGRQPHISTLGDLTHQQRHEFREVVNPVSQRRHCDGMGKRRQQLLDRS